MTRSTRPMKAIGRDQDVIASVKAQVLLFIRKGQGKTASGLSMPPVLINKTVTLGEGEPVKRLHHIYTDEKEAQAKRTDHKRGNDTLSVTMSGPP